MKGFDVVWSCFESLENQALCCDARRGFSAAVFATAVAEPQSNRDSVIQGQNCFFTCPILDVYKYHTFSLSEQVLDS